MGGWDLGGATCCGRTVPYGGPAGGAAGGQVPLSLKWPVGAYALP
eukprot:CAMPEP_0180133320 /NCGR_PEP_ID=MMETSP0986-20121125/9474_1 /TAXON_ID=697907 /ORGANISM="non described non described, Strain CCMP2293" /LENGTH=44 /DNA_ID= /DNA_START= /DNA_END= /DNA_ORIENTATION=